MLNPRHVLITGASRGLGLEFVKQFLRLPSPPKTILATCRNPEQAKDLNEIARNHSNVKILKLDVEDGKSIAGLAKLVESHIEAEGLNLLINNAGVNIRLDIDTADYENMVKSYAIHVVGTLMTVQALLPYLKQAAKSQTGTSLNCNRAAVVNITSSLGSIANNETGGLYPYRTSKAALNMLTKNMHIDLKPEGILCFCLHPGWVQTDMGGPKAPLVKETSIAGMIDVMSKVDENSDVFLNYEGQSMPW